MSKTIRVVRTVTYEIDEAGVDRLVEQMRNSLPVGTRRYGALKITVAHETGLQWPSDGERVLAVDSAPSTALCSAHGEFLISDGGCPGCFADVKQVIEPTDSLPPIAKSAKQRLRK